MLEETQTISVAFTPSFPALPQYVAQAEGFYADHGLEVEAVQVAAGPEMGAAMIGGDIAFAGNIPNNQITLIEAGFDVVGVAQQVSNQFFDIAVASGFDLGGATEWQDVMKALEGANIGVVANGAAAEDIARTLFDEAGVSADAQTYIATGLPDTTLAALINGQVDAAINFDPLFVLAEQQGVGDAAVLAACRRRARGRCCGRRCWSPTSREYAEENPDVVRAYVAATERGDRGDPGPGPAGAGARDHDHRHGSAGRDRRGHVGVRRRLASRRGWSSTPKAWTGPARGCSIDRQVVQGVHRRRLHHDGRVTDRSLAMIMLWTRNACSMVRLTTPPPPPTGARRRAARRQSRVRRRHRGLPRPGPGLGEPVDPRRPVRRRRRPQRLRQDDHLEHAGRPAAPDRRHRDAPRQAGQRTSKDIGYMLARSALAPWRTARRNVELGLELARGAPQGAVGAGDAAAGAGQPRPSSPTSTRRSCPKACASGWRSPARSPSTPTCG